MIVPVSSRVVAEWISRERMAGTLPQEQAARECFRECWGRQVQQERNIRLEEGKSVDDYGEQGAGLVAAYFAAIDPEELMLGVSEAFAVPLVDMNGGILDKPLVGEFDCRVQHDGNTIIVDWKTAARRWPKQQAAKSMQPTAYTYAYRQLQGQDAGFRFDVVVKNKTPVVEQHDTARSTDDFHRMVELAKMAERMIAAEHFLPNEQGFYCSGCSHQQACREWHRCQAKTISVGMAA